MKKNHKKLSIHAYKFNGWLYRTWEFPELVFENNEFYCFKGNNSKIITNHPGTKNHYHSKIKYKMIWFFLKDEWFNVIFRKKNTGYELYINLASPPIIEDGVLKYIDFDLDYVARNVTYNKKMILLDSKEFLENSKNFKYPQLLINKINNTAAKIKQLFKENKLDRFMDVKKLHILG